MSFDRLIRFVGENDQILFGNLDQALPSHEVIGLQVQVLSGNTEDGFTKTDEWTTVKKLLNPLEHTPIVLCAGSNYREHVKETKAILTSRPIVFMTPAERLNGPLDDILVHAEAQSMLDFEGELAFVLSRDAKNITEEEALDYVLGYTIANDVSARNLVSMEVGFNQMGHSKSFDTFGPIGPCIVSTNIIHDPQQLNLITKVNGDIRQNTNTSDMVWTVRQMLAWLSTNRTLKRGTVIMTGTPSGVGWHSGGLLHDGDTVEIEISKIGSIRNKVAFL